MTVEGHKISLPKEQVTQGLALAALLVLAGLAWSENAQMLEQRHAQIAVLAKQRDALKNRVNLLDLDNADPDLVGEELRKNLNVVHPDEVVLIIPSEGQ